MASMPDHINAIAPVSSPLPHHTHHPLLELAQSGRHLRIPSLVPGLVGAVSVQGEGFKKEGLGLLGKRSESGKGKERRERAKPALASSLWYYFVQNTWGRECAPPGPSSRPLHLFITAPQGHAGVLSRQASFGLHGDWQPEKSGQLMWDEHSHSTPDGIKRYKPPPYSVLPFVPQP
ncbi:unnamed protein product [Pleuronectes platessa]|uniref:Uncharacterized protein n=1 Tax=Pleuronectes platessa TaxID=8262 RepID=A0A9N7V778_PLEPL|nr:unnamed protein product [Pleuronectes platessa]